MKYPFIILSIIQTILLGCTTLNKTQPLKNSNFKEHNWKIVYIETEESSNVNKKQNIWVLSDNKIIDSLKNEYSYKPKKRGDGAKEYQIYLFKDNTNHEWACFNNDSDFQLGELRSKFQQVNTAYYHFKNFHSTKTFVDSLKKLNITYTLTPYISTNSNVDEYAIKINLYINGKSKLLIGKNPGYYDSRSYTQEELAKIYPELNEKDYTFIEQEPEKEYLSTAPGDTSSVGNENFQYIKNEQRIIASSKTFDTTRLKNSDLFSRYEICTLYTITIYSPKQ